VVTAAARSAEIAHQHRADAESDQCRFAGVLATVTNRLLVLFTQPLVRLIVYFSRLLLRLIYYLRAAILNLFAHGVSGIAHFASRCLIAIVSGARLRCRCPGRFELLRLVLNIWFHIAPLLFDGLLP